MSSLYLREEDLFVVSADEVVCADELVDGVALQDRAFAGIPELAALLSLRFDGLSHEDTVRAVTRLGFDRRRFNKQLNKLFIEGTENTKRPDAFLISEQKPVGIRWLCSGTIIVVEVDHSNPTSWKKWHHLCYEADTECCWFFVVVIERTGVPVLRWSCGDLLHRLPCPLCSKVAPKQDPLQEAPCFHCGANPNEQCRTSNGSRTRPHRARVAVCDAEGLHQQIREKQRYRGWDEPKESPEEFQRRWERGDPEAVERVERLKTEIAFRSVAQELCCPQHAKNITKESDLPPHLDETGESEDESLQEN